jgi:CubicO group peptidase (beta-lactamase class C family)
MTVCCAKNSALLLLLAAAAPLAQAQDYLDRVVERARQEFEVPGIAVAIVKDGKLVVAKGYGVRKLGEPAPVTADSLFRIASNTKAFTTAALGMLVDEGKIRWDDRVVDHLPWFQMYDPYVTREITIRDLLVHRSGLGLGAGDLMFWPATDFTREQILRRIRFLKPVSSFRSRYAYDNLLYLVAGEVIHAVSGITWDDFVKQRIFVPLGMSHTNSSTAALIAAADVATPHARAGGKLVPLAQTDHDNNAPAGSINSCASDLARWIISRLEIQPKEAWSPQTILPIPDPPAGAPPEIRTLKPTFSTYGLGWVLRDYRGRKLVYHTGTLAGYVSRTMLVPDLQLGVVILTNAEEEGAHSAIGWTVIDHYLGAPATDWVSAFRKLAGIEKAEGEAEVRKASGTRNAASKPSLPLTAYAGRYRDDWYGDIVVEDRGGKLGISFTHTKQLTGGLEHWQYDTFIARWRDRTLNADAYVTFYLGADGAIEDVRIKPVSPLTDFSFDFQDLHPRPVR